MPDSDNKNLPQNPQDPLSLLAEKLDIIIILLREGLNVPDENTSLKQHINPTIIS